MANFTRQYPPPHHGAKRKSFHPVHATDVEGSACEECDEQYAMQHTAPLF